VTTSWFSPAPASRSRGPLSAIVIGIAGALAFLGLVLTGLVFFALAIAFPIAVPLATSMGLPITPHDAALANRFAGFAWLFITLSVAAFGASLAVLALTVRSIAPTED
jgi:hypothetical protein